MFIRRSLSLRQTIWLNSSSDLLLTPEKKKSRSQPQTSRGSYCFLGSMHFYSSLTVVACQIFWIVIQSLAIHRRSSANVMQSQDIPSKIFDGQLKLKKSRSVSIPESNSSLLKSLAGSENCFSPESTINLRVNSTRLSGARRGIVVWKWYQTI